LDFVVNKIWHRECEAYVSVHAQRNWSQLLEEFRSYYKYKKKKFLFENYKATYD
jgi:hypothetical protein